MGQPRWAVAVLTSEQPSILAFHHPPADLGVEIQQRVGLGDRVIEPHTSMSTINSRSFRYVGVC